MTRYVFLAEWHIAGYMVRSTRCGKAIEAPVYTSSSTGGESVCEDCLRDVAFCETKGGGSTPPVDRKKKPAP